MVGVFHCHVTFPACTFEYSTVVVTSRRNEQRLGSTIRRCVSALGLRTASGSMGYMSQKLANIFIKRRSAMVKTSQNLEKKALFYTFLAFVCVFVGDLFFRFLGPEPSYKMDIDVSGFFAHPEIRCSYGALTLLIKTVFFWGPPWRLQIANLRGIFLGTFQKIASRGYS